MKTLTSFILVISILFLFSCNADKRKIITVTGEISAAKIGKTLHHEHILVDFIGADSIGYNRWNKEKVVKKVLPYLLEIKKLGYNTIIECTPAYLGRDPKLLKMLSEKSGLQILTNTGYYAAGAKYIPKHGLTESAEQLANRWIDEAKNGIEGTEIYPGFIKISVENTPLNKISRKVVEAACITHKETGLQLCLTQGQPLPHLKNWKF